MAPQLMPVKGPLLRRPGMVDRAGDDFLAGAALAGDEDRHVGVFDAIDERVDLAHRRARADEALVAEMAAEHRARGAKIAADLVELRGAVPQELFQSSARPLELAVGDLRARPRAPRSR